MVDPGSVPARSLSWVLALPYVVLRRYLATLQVMEAMHMGDEGTVQSEVDFDASTLCCPTATIPVRDVQSLSFVKVWETILLVVFEHADGDVVHSDPDFP